MFPLVNTFYFKKFKKSFSTYILYSFGNGVIIILFTSKNKLTIQEILKMRTNDEIITIIKTTLKEQNMSLSELARRVGMAKSAVSRYLNLTREFPLNRAEDFANALHISTEYLLGFNGSEQTRQQDTMAAHFDKEGLTEEEIEEVNKFIEWVKNRDK